MRSMSFLKGQVVEDSERSLLLFFAPFRLVATVCWKYVKTSCSKSPNPAKLSHLQNWGLEDEWPGPDCGWKFVQRWWLKFGYWRWSWVWFLHRWILIYEPSWCATSKNGGCYIAMLVYDYCMLFSFVLRFCKLFCSTAWIWVIVLTSVWNDQELQPFAEKVRWLVIKHVPHEVKQTHLPEVTWVALCCRPWVYPVLYLHVWPAKKTGCRLHTEFRMVRMVDLQSFNGTPSFQK